MMDHERFAESLRPAPKPRPLSEYERKLPEYYVHGDFEITRSDRGAVWYGDLSPGGEIVRTCEAATPEECAKMMEAW